MNHPESTIGQAIASGTTPIGLMAPSTIQHQAEDLLLLQTIATQLLQDPLQVQHLTERVYQLMKHDLQTQRERLGKYGGRR